MKTHTVVSDLLNANKVEQIVKEIAFDALFKKLPISFYWMNREGILLGCNEKVLSDLNLTEKEFVGKHSMDVTDEYAWENSKMVMEVEQDMTVEEVHEKPDGEKTIYLSIKSPIKESGNVIGLVGVAVDITDIRKKEEELEQAKIENATVKTKAEAEEQLRQAVMVLTGSIAHDLRTPISIIEMELNRIKEYMPALVDAYHKAQAANLPLKAIQKRMLDHLPEVGESVLEETRGMKEFITTSLKTLSKAVSGDMRPENLMSCSIDKCVDQTIRRYPFTKDEHELIKWDRKSDFKFMGNEILMVRILFNLIKNSLEQIKQNNRGEILITTEIREKDNLLHVKDTAGGASPEIVEYLFDGYKTTKEGGTGVGLAFCKRTMKSFGGDITCDSIYGDFIDFILTFPKLSAV